MSTKKSGRQLAVQNVALVESWICERNERRDWHEYEFNGRINRRVLADELSFARSVCTQNRAVKALIEAAEGIWFASGGRERAGQEAALERAEKRTKRMASSNSALARRVAELEAENHALRRQLEMFKQQQALIEAGGAGFKV